MLGSIFFTTIFLTINHLFAIFALPPVSKDNILAGQSHNLTHTLAKRDWFPADQTCNDPADWHSRNCVAQEVDKIWYDTCIDADGDVSYGWGICPDETICMDTYGPEPDLAPTITCAIRPTCDACKPTITGGPPPVSGQTGVQQVNTNYAINPELRGVSITMETSISGASVTAFLEGTYKSSQLTVTCRVSLLNVPNYEGTDGPYLVEPIYPLVGSLRRTKSQTCAYNVTNLDCVPLGTWNLETGDVIDFRFGLGPTLSVRFYYGIFGGGY